MKIGKAYTLGEFLAVCETATKLFDESRKAENKQDKSYTYTDDNGDDIAETPKKELSEEQTEADKTKKMRKKTRVMRPHTCITLKKLPGFRRMI